MHANNTPPPLVAIKCLVFNHEPYLRQCLDGFVMQQTDFPFVAIVHDDASTDRSADIIREYAERYPDIIRPIYETENQYSKGTLGRVMDAAVDATDAKYIALCEGDDYWIAPDKLQKQVDFLESHPDYSMCFHAADISIEGMDSKVKWAQCENIEEKEYNSTEMFVSWIVPMASIVYNRKIYLTFQMVHREWLTRGDIAVVLTCAHVGRVWGMSQQMSIYRMQPHSVLHDPAIHSKEIYHLPKHFRCLYYNFPEVNKESITWCISNAYYGRMKAAHRNIFQRIVDFSCFIYWNPKFAMNKLKSLLSKRVLNNQ